MFPLKGTSSYNICKLIKGIKGEKKLYINCWTFVFVKFRVNWDSIICITTKMTKFQINI